MIELRDVSKSYRTLAGRHTVLKGANASFRDGESIGIVGANGAGKSTLVRLLAGIEKPDNGRVVRHGSISFPLGFSGTFHPSLSARENVRFLARVYGADEHGVIDYVESFAQIGAYFAMPIETYSSGMRAKVAFGACLAIEFDTYLIDEVTAVGDEAFRLRCRAAFEARADKSDVIMVSHDYGTLRAYCGQGAVLANGCLEVHDDIETAIQAHSAAMRRTGQAALRENVI